MKQIILFFMLTISTILFSQYPTKYETTKDGFTDFIVTEVPGKTKEEIYSKTLEWINKTYKNPEKVILAKIENEYIRFEGVESSLDCGAPLGMPICDDVKYQVEVSSKDGKYKFDVIEMQSYSKPSKHSVGGWNVLYANNDTSFIYKKNGTIRGGWKNYYQMIPQYFNSLNQSLLDYISGTGIEAKNDDW